MCHPRNASGVWNLILTTFRAKKWAITVTKFKSLYLETKPGYLYNLYSVQYILQFGTGETPSIYFIFKLLQSTDPII